jgi:hypothetical protein
MCDHYVEPVACSVCGEKGLARAGEGHKIWFGGTFRHTDPEVCADNLRRQRRELEREREALRAGP